jgi:hypothetical protein
MLFTQSALRASLQTAVRVQKFQACHKLARIRLLPSVAVPLCPSEQRHPQFQYGFVNKHSARVGYVLLRDTTLFSLAVLIVRIFVTEKFSNSHAKTRWYSIVHEPQNRSFLKWKIFKFFQKGIMRKVKITAPVNPWWNM